jgi:hypothetical protein
MQRQNRTTLPLNGFIPSTSLRTGVKHNGFAVMHRNRRYVTMQHRLITPPRPLLS